MVAEVGGAMVGLRRIGGNGETGGVKDPGGAQGHALRALMEACVHHRGVNWDPMVTDGEEMVVHGLPMA